MKVMLTVSADQSTHILLNGRIAGHGKRSFAWSQKWAVKATFSRTGWLRETSSRIGRLRKRLLELKGLSKFKNAVKKSPAASEVSTWQLNGAQAKRCTHRSIHLFNAVTVLNFHKCIGHNIELKGRIKNVTQSARPLRQPLYVRLKRTG